MVESRLTEFLRGVPLFSDLEDGELHEVMFLARPFRFEPGQTLCRQGDDADGMYLIEQGSVKISTRLLGEYDVELSTAGPGDVLGELSLLDGGTRSATIEALDATSGYFFNRRRFEALRSDHRPAAFKLMRRVSVMLCARLRTACKEIAALKLTPDLAVPSVVAAPRIQPDAPPAASAPLAVDRTALRAIPPFASFTATEIEELVTPLGRWQYERGQVIFAEGCPANSCFIVTRGAVQVAVDRSTVSQTIAVLGPGRMVGHVELMDGLPRVATCYAREGAVVLEMDRREFDRLMYGASGMALKFFDAVTLMLVDALRTTNRQLIRLAAEVRDDRISNRPPPLGSGERAK